ncbi:uncharacterized protein MONOS_8578 [Monocercomonoides exilis]|uniref:uncharacterized protein n=1 Tax=Monocercomonoides exilis TaxID=2049356 RepID=UPI003559F8DF|nr:hypothetical protein MONOS_8578 [Monocercomonoides exilis]|eukprot:MONOS_8578.1-p1 / transcript=MONOS_8578.1 / gene=MONOS_8578 / organism=Monocercomonoides_exilis_PA203 / gene_product=unspecified product / transcript_product=unspecified product / location=Mono_scaffold00327:5426-6153(+) / protein_length=207 / sequence_SO=supercontig / SO=protein_coding / is_pseudo=false
MPEIPLFQALCTWNIPDVSTWITKGNISLSIYRNTEESTSRLIGVDESKNFVINEYFSSEFPQKHNDLFVTILVGSGQTHGFNFLTSDDATKFMKVATDVITESIAKQEVLTGDGQPSTTQLNSQSESSLISQQPSVTSSSSIPSGSIENPSFLNNILAKDVVSAVGALTFREQMDIFADEMKLYFEKKIKEMQEQITKHLHSQPQ